MKNKIHIVAGPTASGKSAAALSLAKELNGVIINCDSLQIYDALPILTAQPGDEDKAQIPHYLYAALHPNKTCSAGAWVEMATPIIEAALQNNQTPIICGGTGLYMKALTDGLSPMPETPENIRARMIARYEELGSEAFYAEFKAKDPEMAARFHVNHKARILRAAEVLEATGKSLAYWQTIERTPPPAHWNFEWHKITPPRETLYERCNARFEKMLEQGALDEVRDFDARIQAGEVKSDAPITKALGFKELRAYLNGELSREQAITHAKTLTRNYAKRQMTWLRNQI